MPGTTRKITDEAVDEIAQVLIDAAARPETREALANPSSEPK